MTRRGGPGLVFPLLASLFAGGIGCATRDSLNPLDPENPETGGAPRWLLALADQEAVDLSWDVPRTYRDLVAVRLLSLPGERLLWSGPSTLGTFRESGLVNGVDGAYRIELVLASGRVLRLPVETATPGPAVAWAFDAGSRRILRLTPDGRRVREALAAPFAVDVVADPDSGHVLVLDAYAGRVRVLNVAGRELWSRADLDRPSVGLRAPDGWWVGDVGSGVVTFLNLDGTRRWADSTFVFPAGLAPAGENAVWVADRTQGLVRLERDRGRTLELTGTDPVVVGPGAAGGAWFVEGGDGSLVGVDASGVEVARRPGFFGVYALEGDPVLPGGVWAADLYSGRVTLLDFQAEERVSLPGLLAPVDLSVSPDGGEIWVADEGRAAVVRYLREGTEILAGEGAGSVTGISVAFRPAR